MKIPKYKIFHPAQWFMRKKPMFRPEILNPPTWIEKKVNDAKIERDYESSVKAEAPTENVSWVDKYDNDFKGTN
tara:strand:+ start:162 stop:383 length:222 start_codon:yes stop_codon:yes gene_type:complete